MTDPNNIASLFLRHRDTAIVAKEANVPEADVRTFLRVHKKEIMHIVENFEDIQLVMTDDGGIDVEKTLESVTSATVSMVKERSVAMEPVELVGALAETRKQLEVLHKMKKPDAPDQHLHLHNDVAQTIINNILPDRSKKVENGK